jgi:lipid A 4'-phosphatase
MKQFLICLGVAALASALFLFAPEIDLATSRLFYDAKGGFVLSDWPPVIVLYRAVLSISWGLLILVGLGAAWLFLLGRPLWRLDRKALVFLVVSMAVAPGLLANSLLKDHWGRARPVQVEAFGGPHRFTPALLPVAECDENCSFVSGHAALGFALVGFAFLLRPGRTRRGWIAVAIGFGALVGLGRIAQGAHFLSDVVFAGLLVYGVTALLHWWIVQRDGLAPPPFARLGRWIGRNRTVWAAGRVVRASPAMRLALATGATAMLVALSIGLVDRPVALSSHAGDSDLRSLFEFIGRLGLASGYLIAFGLAFAALHWGGRLPRLRRFARPMQALSAIPAFLFLAIAASGIVVDVLKVVFGRARPKLLIQANIYDFSWLSWRPDHWSFPSGHSATIVALMTALWYLWPQHLLFYILAATIVAASRIVVGAHYLSDVLAGALIAMLTTRYAAQILAKGGIDLTAARLGSSAPGEALPWPCRRLLRAPGWLIDKLGRLHAATSQSVISSRIRPHLPGLARRHGLAHRHVRQRSGREHPL